MVQRARRARDSKPDQDRSPGALTLVGAVPVGVRIAFLAVALILAAYTLFAIRRADWRVQAHESGHGVASSADLLAARAEGDIATLRTALGAAGEVYQRDASRPLEAAEIARAAARPIASAVALVGADGVRAVSGRAPGAEWAAAARAARRSGRSLWIGSGAGSAYVAVPAGDRGWLIAAWDPARVLAAPARGERLILAAPDGAVIASAGAIRPAAGATLQDLFGVAAEEASALAARSDPAISRNAHGERTSLAARGVGDGALVALVARPAAGPAGSGSLIDDLTVLLTPLAIGALLTLLLVLQARRAARAGRSWAESEQRFRLAVEAARCGIWEWDLTTDQVFMSDVTGVMLGWGGGGVASGEEVLQRVGPEHRDKLRAALQSAAGDGAIDVSFRVPGAQGRSAWIDARGQAAGERGPNGYARLIGVALDVSQERTAQVRAHLAENRLRDAIESASEAFVLWDRQGRLLMCNTRYSEFFGIEPRVLKPGAARHGVEAIARLSIEREETMPDSARGVREVELSDGRWLHISERRTTDGGMVMVGADITAVKRQEENRRKNEEALTELVRKLERSQAELTELARKYADEKLRAESASKAKTDFLANMSHELRTPLNAINGFSEIMQTELFGPLGDARYKEYAGDILASGQHLLSMINDILDMSKIEAGKLNLRFEPLEAEDVVREAVRLMRNRAETAELELAVEIHPDTPELEADYRALKQVLLNLISNAVKFTPVGGKVTVSVGPAPEGVRLVVRDTGIGIAAHDLERLARPFEQIESQTDKTRQGTGLGLALSKSLVEMHHGRLELTSRPGAGTAVIVALPLRQPGDAAEAEAA